MLERNLVWESVKWNTTELFIIFYPGWKFLQELQKWAGFLGLSTLFTSLDF